MEKDQKQKIEVVAENEKLLQDLKNREKALSEREKALKAKEQSILKNDFLKNGGIEKKWDEYSSIILKAKNVGLTDENLNLSSFFEKKSEQKSSPSPHFPNQFSNQKPVEKQWKINLKGTPLEGGEKEQ